MIEVLEFRLAAGVEEDQFLTADRRVQVEFAYQQPGLQRRTTARGTDGHWIVVDLWRSAEEADSSEARWGLDQVCQEFMGLLDPSTVRTRRYFELD